MMDIPKGVLFLFICPGTAFKMKGFPFVSVEFNDFRLRYSVYNEEY